MHLNYPLSPFAEAVNMHTIKDKNLLEFFITGRTSEDVDRMTLEEIQIAVVDLIRPQYKDKNLNVMKVFRSQWSKDPFTYGAISSMGDDEIKKVFVEPEGRLMFAGEHTSVFLPGYAGGAWDSGSRAAKQILNKLK